MDPSKPDVFSAGFREDPYPVYATLRRDQPVYREPRYGGYLLTRFDDVLEIEVRTELSNDLPGSSDITNVWWFARDVGPVQVDFPGEGGLSLLRGARVDGDVIGNPAN